MKVVYIVLSCSLYISKSNFKKVIHQWSKDNQWSMKIFDSDEQSILPALRENINFQPLINKSHVLREEVFNEIFLGEYI